MRWTSAISHHSSVHPDAEGESLGFTVTVTLVLPNSKLATNPEHSHGCQCLRHSPCFLSGQHLIHIIVFLANWEGNHPISRHRKCKKNSSRHRIAISAYIHSTSDSNGVTHIWQHWGIFPRPKPDPEIALGWDPTGGNCPGHGGRRGGRWRLAEQLTSRWLFMSSFCLNSEFLAGGFKRGKPCLSLSRGFNGYKDQEPEYSLGPASWHHYLSHSEEPESES